MRIFLDAGTPCDYRAPPMNDVGRLLLPSRDRIIRTTTLRSCSDKSQQFAGWGAISAEKHLVHCSYATVTGISLVQTVQKTVKIPQCSSWENCRACCATTLTVQITVCVPQLQFSWVLQFSNKVVYMPAVVQFLRQCGRSPCCAVQWCSAGIRKFHW